ncbi:MAG: hypothetical protein KDJ39_05920 [Gammaproteobacteria bacterium]|nr:hypothetical protein [Gammaproteobacteria bacterium]
MGLNDLLTDGPVVAMITNAGNGGLIVPMVVTGYMVAWSLVRMSWPPADRRALVGDMIEHFSWAGYRLFWLLAIIYSANHPISCVDCQMMIKANSYAEWAWNYRGIVTLLASVGVTYGAITRLSAFLPLMRRPYLKAFGMLFTSWVAGALSPIYGVVPIVIIMCCCVGMVTLRFERALVTEV